MIRDKILRRTGNITLLVLLALLILCVVLTWDNRSTALRLPFLPGSARPRTVQQKALVDVTPWQTAHSLSTLAVTVEEIEFAREAERLADHEVDQAFASALREATLQAQHRTLTGGVLVLSQRVDELQQMLNQDMAQLERLTQAKSAPTPAIKGAPQVQVDDTDVEIARAQIQLDSDQLEDAQQDLATASGDNRARIQSEHAAREAAMKKYESEARGGGTTAVVAASRIGTLIGRIAAWNRQRTRLQLLKQAIQQAQSDLGALSKEHDDLEARTNADQGAAAAGDRSAKLATIRDLSAERQLLSIYHDRIQTQQGLVTVYSNWSDQVVRQRRIVQGLVVQSIAFICLVLICMILVGRLVRRLMSRHWLDPRQAGTLRMILELSVQIAGVVVILFIVFGVPDNTATIVGFATAAITIALQDFIISFLGWFRLVGKRGIRVGDLVEINTVAGEVVEIGLITTTLLETGPRGYRTGRRITFMNSFAIRGVYFNFSTIGQWMWDELTITLPSPLDTRATMKQLLEVVNEETGQSARMAELEWKRGTQREGLSHLRTDAAVNLRPTGSGVDIEIRYVTRAWDRVEMRNRLYDRIHELIHQRSTQPEAVG
jgi:small-conductance mechanosensitive channel